MKKNLLLFFSCFAFVTGYSQFGGTPPKCDNPPPGYTLSQGAKFGPYVNPDNNCAEDCGIETPGVGGNNPANIITPPELANCAGYTVCFDIFVFDANLKCESSKDFPCPTYITFYIVSGNYSGSHPPDPSSPDYFGESDRVLITTEPGKRRKCGIVNFSKPCDPTATATYRIFIDFTSDLTCNQSGTKYIIDNIDLTQQGPLPVTFKSFSAARNKQNVSLEWETASETNNKGFNVQRNGGGGWQTVAFVNSKADGGNSSSILSYSYNDVNTLRGVTQYRVQQVDIDGKSSYSDIRAVRGEGLSGRLLVYPNPSNTGIVNVVFEDQNALRDVLVRDMSGRLVKQYKEVTNNILVIDNLVNGVYSIQVTDRTTSQSVFEKVIIRRN